MVKRIVFPALLALALAACSQSDSVAPSAVVKAPLVVSDFVVAIPDRYIVVFHDSVNNVVTTTERLVRVHAGTLHHTYTSALHGFAGSFTPVEIERMRSDPSVGYIEADQIARIVGTQLNPPSWGLDRTDQRNLPLDASYTANDATGVHAYIIDTGIRTTHIDFGGRATFDVNKNSDGMLIDCNGHGTHVSGTVGGATYGIAKNVRLHAVRVLNCAGSGAYSDVIAGVDWVTANHQSPAVANMSLGGGPSAALDAAVVNSINSGVFYGIAAGNSSYSACNDSPSRVPQATTVGATTIKDSLASFSNFGSCVDILAPGLAITSAWNGSDTDVNTISGTSMATPHVVGVAALYLQANPLATPAQVGAALTANATPGKIPGLPAGTPNLLLYSGFIGGANQAPVASFTFSCTNLACSFNGTGSTDDVGIVSYAWTFGDGGTATGVTPSRTYGAAGTYSVTLTVTDGGGLTGTQTKSVTVTSGPPNLPPVANFTFSCTGKTCSFNGSGSTDDVGIVSYAWTFGDATSGSGVTTSRTYAAGGPKTVTLTVTDGGGLTNSRTQTVPVNPPTAGFTFSCTNLVCSFNAEASTTFPNGFGSVLWNFGDGTPTVPNAGKPSHTFAAAGTYSVSFTITDATGLVATSTQLVTVTSANQAPVASFTFSCTNLACSFNGTGSTDDVGIVSYAWTFGDGGTATGVTPSRTYGAAGTYSVTLTVTDGGGLTGTQTKSVTVTSGPPNLPPVANFTFSCTGKTCSFNGSGSTDDVGIVSYAWTFGDATSGSGVTTSRTYAAGGPKTVTLTVTDGGGLTNSLTQSVPVNPPTAGFSFGCTNLVCNFNAEASTTFPNGFGSVLWNFGDGTPTVPNAGKPTHTFAAAGTYNVSFTNTDATGLVATATNPVTVP